MTRSRGRRRGTPRPSRSLPPPQADWAYFFDIDGTLVDFADSPGGVRADGSLIRLIGDLFRTTGGAVALVSGRSIADIDRLFPGLRLPAAGQHGIERRAPSGRTTRHAPRSGPLHRADERLAEAVAGRPGLMVERKGLSFALHYRRAPRLAAYAHRLARSVLSQMGDRYCLQSGKRVVEVKPVGKDKGVAVVDFMKDRPFRGRTSVFVGDDVSDEHGFGIVNRMRGYSVKVGPGPTVARWRLRDVRAVRAWLKRGPRRRDGGREAEPAR